MNQHHNPITSGSGAHDVLAAIGDELRARSVLATLDASDQFKATAEELAQGAASDLTPPWQQPGPLDAILPTADWYTAERPWLDTTRDPQERFGALWDAAGRCGVAVSTAEVLATREALYRWSATQTLFKCDNQDDA